MQCPGKKQCGNTFAMDKHTHLLLTEHFPTARFFSTASPLTEYFARKSRLGNSRKLYTYIREQQMEVFVLIRATYY